MGVTVTIPTGSFAARMRIRASTLQASIERGIVTYATTLHRELVETTPKLTGQAAGNWQMSLVGVGSGFLPGDRLIHPPQRLDYEGYAAAAEAEIQLFTLGDTISIYNNVPYISRLNEGYSPQAVTGFVEAAQQTAFGALNAAVRL